MRKRKPTSCKFCGASNLVWNRCGSKWVLFEENGLAHFCTNARCPDCGEPGLRPARVDGKTCFKKKKSGEVHVCKTVNDNSVPQPTSQESHHDQNNEGENSAV